MPLSYLITPNLQPLCDTVKQVQLLTTEITEYTELKNA